MGAEGDSSQPRVSGGGEEEQQAVVINIRCSNGSKFTVRTSLGSMVSAFKAVLAQNCDVPAEQQRLIYKGRILKDDQTLESYGTCINFSLCLWKFFFKKELLIGFRLIRVFFYFLFLIFMLNL